MIKLRNYKVDDYSRVKEILKEAKLFDSVWDSAENINGKINNNPESILVAVENGEIVGIVIIVDYGPKLKYLFRLVVKKELRGRGTATKLIEFATKYSKQKGASEVGLYVDADNKNLTSFYAKRGFKKSKSKYYYMWLDLK